MRFYSGAFLRMVAVAALVAATGPGAAAEDGARSYQDHCASCHGADLSGAAGPALSGKNFERRWHGKTDRLLAQISRTMPAQAPASLTEAQYHAITGYIQAQNEAPAAKASKTSAAKTHAAKRPARLPSEPTSYGTASTAFPDDAELMAPSEGDWLRYNRDYQGQRYAPLKQITPRNAASLAPKCIFQTGETGTFQAAPIIRDGRLYVTTGFNVYALDAATCRLLWKYQGKSDIKAAIPTNRGVALYKGLAIRGTLDGHLIALDAATGTLVWDVWVADHDKGYFISGVPVVFDGKLFVGEAGADDGAAGHVHAFDAVTGRHLWSFDVVPKGKQPGAETWGKGTVTGGGSMWSTITVETATRRLYISTGNPGEDLDGRNRVGDNLYTDSVIVLDADTGKLQWYVQQNAHDVHDWDTAAAPIIYDRDGRKFLVVGSKDAYLYFYDRDSHALIAKKELARRINDTLPLPSDKPLRVCPGALGGVEWNGPAYDPARGLVFVNSVDWCSLLKSREDPKMEDVHGGEFAWTPLSEARGSVRAFDAATGEERWVYEAGQPMLAGVTPTASGVLLTGTSQGDFLVFDSQSGRKLYSFYTGGSIAGGPSTYMVQGKQYVAVASGNNSKSIWQINGAATVVVFGLP